MPKLTASCNPFRTRRLEQLPFRSPADASLFNWDRLFAEFAPFRFRVRGAVVGPHGSGKTTFLVELKKRLEARGRSVAMLRTNRDAGHRIPGEWFRVLRATGERTLVLADGYDVLGPLWRLWLRRVLRPRGGLIVTAHRRCALPALLETRTSTRLLGALVDELYADIPCAGRPTEDRIEHLYHAHQGNLREAFRELYAMPSVPNL